MKKVLGMTAAAVLMAAVLAQAEEAGAPGRFGVGYQGAYNSGSGSSYFVNMISLRYAPKPWGGALVFGHYNENGYEAGTDSDGWTIQARCFYTLISRPNSDFYIGASAGYGKSEYETSSSEWDTDAILVGALLGVEWHFTELPELGFNFEIGYNAAFVDEEGDDDTWEGTFVSLGAHYYF